MQCIPLIRFHTTIRRFITLNFSIDRQNKQTINDSREESTFRSDYITPRVLVSLDRSAPGDRAE